MDALADASGQQVLSPYHAMACNPALMVDPLGLRSSVFDNGARSANPPVDPLAYAKAMFPTMHRYVPGGDLFGAGNFARNSMMDDTYTAMVLGRFLAALGESSGQSAANNTASGTAGDIQQSIKDNDYAATTVTVNGENVGDDDYEVVVSADKPEDWKDKIIPLDVPRKIDDFEGFWGKMNFYFLTGGNINGYKYDSDGNLKGFAPITGMAPDVGMGGGWKSLAKTPSLLKHIFRSVKGHVNPLTLTSQNRFIRLFEKVANNPSNLSSTVLNNAQKGQAGFEGFSQTFRNGKQVWVQTYNGNIFNAGVNIIPK